MLKISNTLFVILVFFVSNTISMAREHGRWNEGVVILNSREVIKAQVRLNQQFNVAQVIIDDKIHSIPASRIEKVSVLDEKRALLRTFIALTIEKGNTKTCRFYELVVNGAVQFLAREKEYRLTSEHSLTTFFEKITPAQNREMNNQDYYFFDGKNLIELSNFRKKVLPAFKVYFNKEITVYIKEEHLNVNLPKDQVKIMIYFNQLYNDKLIFTKE